MPGAVGWMRRNALACWFCGLGLLGLLRAGLKFARNASLDALLWLWSAGFLVLVAIGIAILLRDRRRRQNIGDRST
jgi:TM2 domain-containing membrane protein YozV